MSTTHSYIDTASLLLGKLKEAQSTEDVQMVLKRLEEMATEENAIPAAVTLYGLAYLMDEKPWYDFKRGFEALKQAAESNEPFCWFILGSIYLNGKPELTKDPISAKYWIDKAAKAGFKDALVVQELQWGDNPNDFVELHADWLEKMRKWRKWIGLGLLILTGIVVFLCFLL